MSRTSFHLHRGQLFYAKTGRAVPENLIGRMEIRGKTVYRDGRRAGQLRQKTLDPKIKERVQKRVKPGASRVKIKRPRRRTPIDPPKGPIGPIDPPIPPGGLKTPAEAQALANFKNAVEYLIDLKILTPADGDALIQAYINGDDATRSYYWDYVHSLFGDEGFEYYS